MFTGIIEQTGKIKNISKKGNQATITVRFQNEINDLTTGESIAVNGVCLTVVNPSKDSFSADVSEETLNRTNLGEVKVSGPVNLERALKVGERMGGHFVSGHIDGKGNILNKITQGKHVLLTIEAPDKIMKYVIEKGSIAVDGISLTIASCNENSFTISIIPHTEACTNLKSKKKGDTVNLENDLIGKYIEQFVNNKNQKKERKNSLSKNFLQVHGFM